MTTKIQAEIELSTANAEQGFAKVASSAESMSSAVKKSGKEAGDGLSGVGDGGDASAAKIDRSTKSMISSIQRTTAAFEAAGKGKVAMYESLAAQRGIPIDSLRPYLEYLQQVQDAQQEVGMSAAATANAMRMVPAQLTDIIVSLQGGQAPISVMLQQGGQLTDMFGGIGQAARALGGHILSLINPYTVAATAAAALGAAYYYGSEQSKALEESLIKSGNYAGATSSQLNALAESVGKLTGDFSEAREAVKLLSEAGDFSFESIQKLTEAVVASSAVSGKSIKETIEQFEKLKGQPTQAILDLNKTYNFLTLDIYKQIKALEARGETEKAASLAAQNYADSVINKNAAIVENLGYIESAWKGIKEESKGALDTFLSIGRASSDAQKLVVARNQLASMKQMAGNVSADSGAAKEIAAQEALIKTIETRMKASESAAKLDGEIARENKKQVAAQAAFDDYIAKNSKSQKDLAKAESETAFAAATKGIEKESEAYKQAHSVYLSVNKKIDEQFKEKTVSISKVDNAYKTLTKTINEKLVASQIELSTGKALTTAQSLRIQLMDLIADGHSKISAAQIQESEKSIFLMRSNELSRKSYEDLEKSLKSFKASFTADDIAKSLNAQTNAYFDIANAQSKYRESLADSNDLVQLEMQLMGVSAVDRNTAIEQYKIELALKKELLKIKQDTLLTDDEKKDRSDYAKESANIAKSQAGLKAQQQEWSKFYTDIYNGLSDSLYRGFEAGKGFFQNFWDGIKNLFKTTVLKLAVQGVMTGVLGLGATGAATAQGMGGGGLGSTVSAISTGKTLWEGFSAASSIGGGVANILGTPIASIGAALGSSTLTAFASGLTGTVSGFGAVGSVAGAGINAGVMLGGGTAGAATSAGVGISSALAAIPVWGWAALGAAAVASAFGGGKDRVIGNQSVSGTLGTNNLTRNVDWTKDGGWFNADTKGTWNYNLSNSTAKASNGQYYQDTANVANDQKLLKQLNTTYDAIKTASGSYASALGINADVIASRVDKMSFALGKTQKEIDEAIQGMFGTIADDMAKTLIPSIASMTKEGETASEALGRIATGFGTANAIFTDLQLSLFKVSDEGYKASSVFVDLVGGIDALKAASTSYYENFYTQEERNANVLKSLTAEFEKQKIVIDGVEQVLPNTREGFRSIVEELSKTGTPEQLAALFNMNAAFASVYAGIDNAAELAKQQADADKLQSDILQQKLGLQDEYNQLTMTSLELLAQQRAALDASNVGLFDSIQAVKAKQAADAEALALTQAISSQKSSLQAELDNLILSDEEKLKRQRDSLYDVNKAIFDQIQAEKNRITFLEQAKAAEQERQSAEKAAFDAQYSAAKQIQEVWQSAANSIVDEMNRIRGSINQSQGTSYASTQAQFAMTTAQARAGDADAAKLLPTLSKSLLDIYESQATSSLDLVLMQARTAQSLEDTLKLLQVSRGGGLQLPSFAVGTNYVPQDMIAQVHRGEMIVPAAYNPANSGGNNDQLVQVLRSEIAELRTVVSSLLTATENGNTNTADIKKTLNLVTEGGRAMQTEAYS